MERAAPRLLDSAVPAPRVLLGDDFPSFSWVVEDFINELGDATPTGWLNRYEKSGWVIARKENVASYNVAQHDSERREGVRMAVLRFCYFSTRSTMLC